MPQLKPIVLTIAGSDPSGGAGIQADLRTIDRSGLVGISVPTLLTAQTSLGVERVWPVEIESFVAQLSSLIEDIKPNAVKIGAVPSAKHAQNIARIVRKHKLTNVIFDPVISPTTGTSFSETSDHAEIFEALLPICTLVTPNVNEAAFLSATNLGPDSTDDDFQASARSIMLRGVKGVLIKGGHRGGDSVDTYYANNLVHQIRKPRIYTIHLHGTGCLLSTLIACGCAKGLTLNDAIIYASNSLDRSIRHTYKPGSGPGYPVHTPGAAMTTDHRKKPANCISQIASEIPMRGIYFVTEDPSTCVTSVEKMAESALAGGVTVVQLRDKTSSTDECVNLSKRLQKLCNAYGAMFIVNDRVDVALASRADGVHLGPGDMLPLDARQILGPYATIGVSVSTVDEARAAAEYATYFGVGPIFRTSTKHDAGPAIGLQILQLLKEQFPSHPIVAIGGINKHNIVDVARTGVSMVALVSAISLAEDSRGAAAELKSIFNSA